MSYVALYLKTLHLDCTSGITIKKKRLNNKNYFEFYYHCSENY